MIVQGSCVKATVYKSASPRNRTTGTREKWVGSPATAETRPSWVKTMGMSRRGRMEEGAEVYTAMENKPCRKEGGREGERDEGGEGGREG